MMKRLISLALILSLIWTGVPPAYALRGMEVEQQRGSGLEELKNALRPAAGAEEKGRSWIPRVAMLLTGSVIAFWLLQTPPFQQQKPSPAKTTQPAEPAPVKVAEPVVAKEPGMKPKAVPPASPAPVAPAAPVLPVVKGPTLTAKGLLPGDMGGGTAKPGKSNRCGAIVR